MVRASANEWVRLWEDIQREREREWGREREMEQTSDRTRVIERVEKAPLNHNELDASRKLVSHGEQLNIQARTLAPELRHQPLERE